MVKNTKTTRSEFVIIILAISLIVVLFLVFSVSNTYNNKEIKKSPKIEQKLNSEKQTIEGTLEVIHVDDFENKKAYYYYYLRTDDGKKYIIQDLNIDTLASFNSGSKIKVIGSIDRNQNSIEDVENVYYIQPPPLKPNIIGDQRTIVVAVNFRDSPNNPPWWTLEDLREVMFEHPSLSVAAYYSEISYGLISFVGDVVGWYSLPLDPRYCNEDMMINEAINALSRDSNIDLTRYENLVIVFYEGCDWQRPGGARGEMSFFINNMPVTLKVALSYGPQRYIIAHELGHNLGAPQLLPHANAWDCGSEILFGDCNDLEYGDPYDIMGYNVYHMNVINKGRLEWFSGNQFVEVTESGVYEIEPIEIVSTGLKGLKIRRGTAQDSYRTIPLWYFIEYRQPIGVDDTEELRNYISNGILIHSTVYRMVCSPPYMPCEFVYVSQSLLDFTPNSISDRWYDFIDSALQVGIPYYDTSSKITIIPLYRTQDKIYVEVSFGLLKNPSFEIDTGIDYYPNWNEDDNITSNLRPDGYKTIQGGLLDGIVKYQGSRSLKLFTSESRVYSYQDIPVEYNKKYRVSGYIKTDCIDTDCHGTILSECENINHQPIWGYNNCKLNINPIDIRRLFGDNNWTYIEFDVENNRQDAKFLRVLCYNTPDNPSQPIPPGTGVVWCDLFNVIEIPRLPVGSPLFLKEIPREEEFGQ